MARSKSTARGSLNHSMFGTNMHTEYAPPIIESDVGRYKKKCWNYMDGFCKLKDHYRKTCSGARQCANYIDDDSSQERKAKYKDQVDSHSYKESYEIEAHVKRERVRQQINALMIQQPLKYWGCNFESLQCCLVCHNYRKLTQTNKNVKECVYCQAKYRRTRDKQYQSTEPEFLLIDKTPLPKKSKTVPNTETCKIDTKVKTKRRKRTYEARWIRIAQSDSVTILNRRIPCNALYGAFYDKTEETNFHFVIENPTLYAIQRGLYYIGYRVFDDKYEQHGWDKITYEWKQFLIPDESELGQIINYCLSLHNQ